jgi:XTP/dITP diphosphohydrolase
VILRPYGLKVESVDAKGEEIQADSTAEVAAHSAKAAAAKLGRPVLVEDAGLSVDSLEGFPGPYSAYALRTIGIAGLVKLLGSSSKRGAHFTSSVAYCEPSKSPQVFEGTVEGRIARSPAGKNGFGFDPIFVAEGQRKTFGELTTEEKSGLSHRGAALRKFAAWYASQAKR